MSNALQGSRGSLEACHDEASRAMRRFERAVRIRVAVLAILPSLRRAWRSWPHRFDGQGRGVVGSTSMILGFIQNETRKAVGDSERQGERLSFVLGTESGMITSIVKAVQSELKTHPTGTQVCGVDDRVAADHALCDLLRDLPANSVPSLGSLLSLGNVVSWMG